MSSRQAQAERRVRDAIALNMKVRLLAETKAELAALERAISDARVSRRVSARFASTVEAEDHCGFDQRQVELEQELRDYMDR